MGLIVWCTINVVIICIGTSVTCISETAAKGKVISENEQQYLVDFSEYAIKQEYQGDYSHRFINKDNCVKDEK